MKKTIELNNTQVPYTMKRSKRAKRLRIAVYCDASVVVTVPQRVGHSVVEKFIRSKSTWLFEKIKFFKTVEQELSFKFVHKDYLKHKEEAKELIHERLEYFNTMYKFKYNEVIVKNQKTVWGSCTKKKNLNINYKILFLPKELQDFVIVHELCHLKEMNHSDKFWNLLSKAFPDYRKLRDKLKKHGLRLDS